MVEAVPVPAVTALSFQEVRDAARAGADDLLVKPFAPAEVVERAQRLLAGRWGAAA